VKELAASVVAMEAAAVAVARQGMLSSTRLELLSFPSSTWRSPSPSKSADTIDNVDVLPPGSLMLVRNVPPLALSVSTVDRRARWRAPEEGTQKKSLDAAVA
jgi:hypothetical protein